MDLGMGGGNPSDPMVCVKHWKSFYIWSVKLY